MRPRPPSATRATPRARPAATRCYLRNIPVPERLVEALRAGKHEAHILDAASVPAADGLVEGGARLAHTEEHLVHGGDPRDVPGGDVGVEALAVVEEAAHVGDLGRVPGLDGAPLRRVVRPR